MAGFFSDLFAIGRQARGEIEWQPNRAEKVVRRVIDRPGLDGFQWKVWLVAGSGFFTTSYSIFSTNVIIPALEYVYPDCGGSGSTANPSLVINLTTLGGTMLGMLLFGHLADRYGRKSIYGVELVIVIVATVGMTTATSGHGDYMNIYGWIGFWRFLLGIGLGAEYPLSALMVAEWSSTRSRGRMMAAVFLMQSVGQLAAYGLGLAVLALVRLGRGLSPEETSYAVASPVIDEFWRIVIGIGAAPALLAIWFRRLIPETPLWLAVHRRVADATDALGAVYPYRRDEETARRSSTVSNEDAQGGDGEDDDERSVVRRLIDYLARVRRYLAQEDRWRVLLGVMIVWFLVDVAFYGLGLDNPRTVSTIWLSSPANLTSLLSCDEAWRSDPAQPTISIYDMLAQDNIRNMITISTGTVTGSAIVLLAIDYVPRVAWMGCWFVALGLLFLVNGSTFFVAFESDKYALTITLYVLAQAMFNLGPNTITFILPAELFDTRYRGTLYGLAAAAGKLGAIAIQVIVNLKVQNRGGPQFAELMLGLFPTMLLGALVTWVWIPEVQFPRGHTDREQSRSRSDGHEDGGSDDDDDDDDDDQDEPGRSLIRQTFRQKLVLPNRPLEDIAARPSHGQVIGFRKNIRRLFGATAGKLGQSTSNGSRSPRSHPTAMQNGMGVEMSQAQPRP